MSDDSDLERLKARRLAEMQRNISSQRDPGEGRGAPDPAAAAAGGGAGRADYRGAVVKILGYRGEEVLRNAESQYPDQTMMVVRRLGELVLSGEVGERIDGGGLLALFRSVGINVRMDTKIHVEKDGKMVSLSDKLGSAGGGGGGGVGGGGGT